MPQVLIHLHIPKNAGTTLSRMLKAGFLLRPPTNLLHPRDTLGHYNLVPWERKVERIGALPPARRARVRFFEAHCGYGVHEPLGLPCRYFTMLRQPVDRALSVFYYLKRTGDLPPDATLEEFLSRPPPERVWFIDNAQVRFLCGRSGQIDERPVGSCTPDMLALARERLERDFVSFGVMERFDDSAVLLIRALGWRNAWAVRSNVTGARKSAAEVDPAVRNRLADMNRLDTELHRWAAEAVARRVAEGGDALARQTGRFRRRSAAAGRVLGPALEWATNAKRRFRRARRARAGGGPAPVRINRGADAPPQPDVPISPGPPLIQP